MLWYVAVLADYLDLALDDIATNLAKLASRQDRGVLTAPRTTAETISDELRETLPRADLVTTAPVVGQAWRDGSRQARLARALAMIDVRDAGLHEAKSAGSLLARAGTSDVVDALVALLAQPGDQVLTSDPEDLGRLSSVHLSDVRVVAVQLVAARDIKPW
ncbi:MAG: hypothetical protein ACRDP8_21760 [Actinopolymorphaceae bacterium]